MNEVLSDLFGGSHRRRARAHVAAVIPVPSVVKYESRQFVLVLTTTLHVLRVHGAQASRVLFVFYIVPRNKQIGRSTSIVPKYHASNVKCARKTVECKTTTMYRTCYQVVVKLECCCFSFVSLPF